MWPFNRKKKNKDINRYSGGGGSATPTQRSDDSFVNSMMWSSIFSSSCSGHSSSDSSSQHDSGSSYDTGSSYDSGSSDSGSSCSCD